MLVLSRRVNEKLLIPEINTAIQVVGIKSGVVRLGIDAPSDVTVLREELALHPDKKGQRSVPSVDRNRMREIDHLLNNRLNVLNKGIRVLRQQLEGGQREDASLTLDELEDELHLLRQRLDRELLQSHSVTSTGNGKRARALLVEDNANERELLATFLRTSGVEVDTAADGIDAMDYLHERGRPDIVLLDMGLPRCDGAATVREIRRDPAYAGLKIFAVSGHLPEEYDLACGPAGIDRWFHKPINPEELVRNLTTDLACSTSLVP